MKGPPLAQGDVILRCPVPLVTRSGGDYDIEEMMLDVLVLTQSCDLENTKVDTVLLGRIQSWEAVVTAESARGNTFIKGKEARKKLQQGAFPNFCLLHRSVAPELSWSVVDFHELHTMRRSELEQHAASLGARLRLISPYREHVAQSFARYFMRVGLPLDAAEFVRE